MKSYGQDGTIITWDGASYHYEERWHVSPPWPFSEALYNCLVQLKRDRQRIQAWVREAWPPGQTEPIHRTDVRDRTWGKEPYMGLEAPRVKGDRFVLQLLLTAQRRIRRREDLGLLTPEVVYEAVGRGPAQKPPKIPRWVPSDAQP